MSLDWDRTSQLSCTHSSKTVYAGRNFNVRADRHYSVESTYENQVRVGILHLILSTYQGRAKVKVFIIRIFKTAASYPDNHLVNSKFWRMRYT